MAKSSITYKLGDQPRNKRDITKEYIQEFYSCNVAAGNIDEDALQNWINFLKTEEEKTDISTMTRFANIRAEFIKRHFNYLNDKNGSGYTQFFEALKKDLKQSKSLTNLEEDRKES